MRVLLDTTYMRRGTSGTGIYLARISEALREAGVDLVEAANERRGRPGRGKASSVVNLLSDLWWTSVELPRLARSVHADVIHHALPAICPVAPCAQVITVHDLAFERLPQHFDPAFRAYARLTHRAAARRAGAVIAVSDTTARDVRALWGIPPERIVVARHGPGQELPAPARAREPSHFLYVGDAEPRKNLALLLAAHQIYRERLDGSALPLVLAGAVPDPAPAGATLAPRPESDSLARLYAQAAALVHPALHEGFGLTLLEAMRAGAPVVAARSAAATEVCGADALYVDPHDPRELADALARVAGDAELRSDMSERGRRRAAAFSWRRAALAHIDAYELALRGGRS